MSTTSTPIPEALAGDFEKGAQKEYSAPSDDASPVATIVKEPDSDKEQFLVALDANEDPKNISLLHKWVIVLVVSTSALCSTCASSMVRCHPMPREHATDEDASRPRTQMQVSHMNFTSARR